MSSSVTPKPPGPPTSIADRQLEDIELALADMPRSPHGGNIHQDETWLVSYADMMTLLFGLFVILFSMSSIDQAKYEKFKKATVEQLQRDGQIVEYQYPTEALKKALVDKLTASGLSLNDVEITQTIDGLKISLRSSSFFQSGQTDLSEQGGRFVAQVGQSVAQFGNQYHVRVEGHTDDIPIRSERFPSNWELSAVRATEVVRSLIQIGIAPSRLTAMGYADSRPIAPNRTPAGVPIDANMAKNRRVVIEVLVAAPQESTGTDDN